jgi:hypothetical protein
MQRALDSLMKKWMYVCETKDEKCKEQFKHGMEKLVQNSAEENGVWQSRRSRPRNNYACLLLQYLL